MDRLAILVLHCLGNPALAPSFLNHHVFALQNYFPEHDYLFHDANLPVPSYIAELEFDAILLDVTFLKARWASQEFFRRWKKSYAFVGLSPAIKIALPQDEYDCNQLLDDWMCEWKIDIVFSVIASGWDVLYPRYHKHGDIRLGYTGYIDESMIDCPVRPLRMRKIDIGYRARKLPPYFGRVGQTKWTIGRDVKLLARQAGYNVDIELGDVGTLFGEAWANFISDSKFTLGANSGSSLLDPTGKIQRLVCAYMEKKPHATYEEVEAACFPGMEGTGSFTAISPRVLEAALLGSAQILVDGEYSGIISPTDHFIPIRSDASNFAEVSAAMKDTAAVELMIKRCRETILDVDALRYRNHAKNLLNIIGDLAARKGGAPNRDRVRDSIVRYRRQMQHKYRLYWGLQKCKMHILRAIAPYPFFLRKLRTVARALR
jgi:hypothetical protein